MKNRQRLDNYLVSQGYFNTKSRAQAAILSGDVRVNDETVTKAGTLITSDVRIEVKHMPYVSRGGFKLEKAAREFEISFDRRICLDIGASTGGFTDFMLQKGALKVYAIDVGYGQLAWKLRCAPQVKVFERTNIRNVTKPDIYSPEDEPATFAAVDVSFISLIKVLANIKTLLAPEKQEFILLLKPQFEAGKEQVPKNGVIRDKNIHMEIIERIAGFAEELGLVPAGLTYSPIKGPAGNIEYLLYLSNKPDCGKIEKENILKTVENAHEYL